MNLRFLRIERAVGNVFEAALAAAGVAIGAAIIVFIYAAIIITALDWGMK